MFRVFLKSRADKQFAKLPRDLKQRFYEEFQKLGYNPFRHPSVKKIKGTERGYRLRIERWRILFVLFSKEKRIEIIDIFLKKNKKDYRKRLESLK